jgi:hypothetical protein
VNAYERPAVVLQTLENYLGADVMGRVMRTWFERYRFQHPASRDFARLVSEVSGRDMSWFFDQFVFGTNWLNYRVESLESERVEDRGGSFVVNGKRVIRDSKPMPGAPYRIRVRLGREGEAIFPVEMKLTLDSGEVVREQWDGRERWVDYTYTKPSRARSVEIDPDGRVLLDGSLADNSYVAKPSRLPFVKWGSDLLFWVQMVLP